MANQIAVQASMYQLNWGNNSTCFQMHGIPRSHSAVQPSPLKHAVHAIPPCSGSTGWVSGDVYDEVCMVPAFRPIFLPS
jgi:hypothetical protein